jgi:hypothetical protein
MFRQSVYLSHHKSRMDKLIVSACGSSKQPPEPPPELRCSERWESKTCIYALIDITKMF